MFDFVRRHTRIMQFLLFLLIFPSFVLFGIDGYNRFNEKGEKVAEVDGQAINQADWDAAHRQQVERLRAQMPGLDLKMFDTPQAKYGTLERMVQERLIQVATQKQMIQVSDQRLANLLQQDPNIASLRKADGSIDVERYRQLAASQGLTPEGLEARIRQDIAQRQVLSGITESASLPDSIANLTIAAFFELRDIQVARFTPEAHRAGLKPTEDDLKAFLAKNTSRYQLPQKADIEYVVLDLATVEKDIGLPEADLRTYFEQNQQALASKEERRASHILINAPKDMPATERAKARDKAMTLLEQLKKQPKDFSALARKNSQDPGSAVQGGDLDYFTRGAMVKPFEDATFSLDVGALSDLVETDFGYHIILLTDIRKPKGKTFEQARPELEKELRRQLAQRKFAEVAEQFSNLVYEQADTLKPVSDKLKLTVQTASGVTPQTRAQAHWANPKVLAALFSTEAIERKRNTEAIEVGPSIMVSARMTQHSPARALTLDEASETLVRDWTQERAAELARQQGIEALKNWKGQPATAKFEPSVTVSRDKPGGVPPPVLDAALRASTASLPDWLGVDLGEQGYAVVKVNQVLPAQNLEQRKAERNQLAQASANAQARAYLESLKAKLKARVIVPKPEGA
ncbi:MAG: SurA N-terminal domain-containing protein [Alphaproteobacteria bacterium]|nr:SurA N-terminal domain-containing protein [Alphaproteobacteria bacterium]